MCGIAGAVWRDGEDRAVLHEMTRRLAHRGPDDEQFHWGRRAALGVRRLAIMDPAHGRQPTFGANGRSVAVCNGEIYDHAVHRAALVAAGQTFPSASDAEVIPRLYDAYGADFVSHMRGEFALAVVGGDERHLVLARDPLGIKPLYYLETASGFWFSSEIKSFLAVPDFRPEVDRAALDLMLAFKHIPGRATLLAGVRCVRAGERLVYDLGRHTFRTEPYYRIADSPRSAPLEVAAAEVNRLLDEAVRMRLMSDVPLGVALSGGLDSSAVVASVARQTATAPRTFSVYAGDTVDELGYARLVAERYGTDHEEVRVAPADLDALVPRVMWHLEEPMSISELPTWLLGSAVAGKVRVLLCGEGSDELFCGYKRLVPIANAPWMPPRVLEWGYLRGINGLTEGDRAGMYSAAQRAGMVGNTNPWLHKALGDTNAPTLNRVSRYELTEQLRSQVTRLDKLTMAHGVEARCPFLDPALVDYVANLPPGLKIRRLREKVLLKAAMEDRLPAEIVQRRKFGMSNPVRALFAGDFRDLCRERLRSRADVLGAYFDPGALDRLFGSIGRRPAWWRLPEQNLFHVYLFDAWHELFVEGAAVGSLAESPELAA